MAGIEAAFERPQATNGTAWIVKLVPAMQLGKNKHKLRLEPLEPRMMLAGPDGSGFTTEPVVVGLERPIAFTQSPSGQIFIAEKAGVVKIVEDGQIVSTFIDLSHEVESEGERGLIGIALDPDFDNNGYVYLNYSVKKSNPQCNPPIEPPAGLTACGQLIRVAASDANPLVADPSTRQVMLDGHVMTASSHTVGDVDFDKDGHLIFTWGDGGFDTDSRLEAQNKNSYQGKLFRIDSNTGFGVPGNPFYDASDPDSVTSKIWALGLRNPWRIYVDDASGDVIIGEVTDEGPEEINVIRADGSTSPLNFGWPYYQGDRRTDPATHGIPPVNFEYTSPLFTYDHLNLPNGDAIVGGEIYRGTTYPEIYRGRYFFGNTRQNVLYTADLQGNYQQFGNLGDYSLPVDIKQHSDGHMYVLSMFPGELHRLVYEGGGGNLPPVALASASPTAGRGSLQVTFDATSSFDPNGDAISFSWDFDSNGTVDATDALTTHEFAAAGRTTTTLTISDNTGATDELTLEFDVLGQAIAVADYRDDFQGGSFPTGWQYLWNPEHRSIGDASGFVPLEWSGERWETDGDTAYPNSDPGRYLSLTALGGIPGQGASSTDLDHYAIAGYTVGQRGLYSISDSFVRNANRNGSNGAEVRVYINSRLVVEKTYPDNGSVEFDGSLGTLASGDTIYVAVGPRGASNHDRFEWDFTILMEPAVVASFQDDFRGEIPSAGWQYLRNDNNKPIGDPRNYVPLQWSGTRWEGDADTVFPEPDQAGFGHFSARHGHPGRGRLNGVDTTVDHYSIAAFTIGADGEYAISDGFVAHRSSSLSNGGELRVYVDTRLIQKQIYPDNGSVTFDVPLGSLSVGDTVYVAIGPNGDDTGDSFKLDFSVELMGAPHNLALGKPTQQTTTAFDSISSRAVDGNTDGDWFHDSVTLTEQVRQPYWEVDLLDTYNLTSIEIFSRTDGDAGKNLRDYWVLVNDIPFSSGNINAVLEDPGVWSQFHAGNADPNEIIHLNKRGRYIRVQMVGLNEILSLAEVRVFDYETDPLDVDRSGTVSPLDANIVITELTQRQMSDPVTGKSLSSDAGPPFVDVNGDGFVSPLDALAVINFLTARAGQQTAALFAPATSAFGPRHETAATSISTIRKEPAIDAAITELMWLERLTSTAEIQCARTDCHPHARGEKRTLCDTKQVQL